MKTKDKENKKCRKSGTVKDRQYRATFCPAQSQDVSRKGMDIGAF